MACHRSGSCDVEIPVPECLSSAMFVKNKRLLGAGPSNPPDGVLRALSLPMMGHLHPETLKVTINLHIIDIKACLSNDARQLVQLN